MNFHRCLTTDLSSDLGLLYLEDDILFKEGWDKTLQEVILQTKQHASEFVLSIYSPYNLLNYETDIVEFKKGFYGTQGVFFTSGIIKDFAHKVMTEGVLSYRHMADLLLQEYCVEKNIPLYVLKHSLVQHIGEESSIHDNTFHKSISF